MSDQEINYLIDLGYIRFIYCIDIENQLRNDLKIIQLSDLDQLINYVHNVHLALFLEMEILDLDDQTQRLLEIDEEIVVQLRIE